MYKVHVSRTALVAVVLGALAGCGTPSLGRAPPAAVDLAGAWVLDRAASDDAERIVAAALPKPRRVQGRAPADARDAGPSDARDAGPSDARDADRPGAREAFPLRARGGGARGFVREYVVPAEHLELRPGPAATYEIVQGPRRRTHELGTESPPTVTDRYGSRLVRAGWDGRTLVVTGEGGRELRLIETFHAGPSADTLAYRVELQAQGLKKIEIDALYRRAAAPPPAREPLEGPPAPLR